MEAKKGDWVRIHQILIPAEDRSVNLPEDTRQVPLEMWDKGFLIDDQGCFGEKVTIETIIGRVITGDLVEINPSYDVNYGGCVTETLYIGKQLREFMGDDDDKE